MKIYIKGVILVVMVVSLGFEFIGSTAVRAAGTTPGLGAAASFGLLAGTYTNTTGDTIYGDVGYTTPPATLPTIINGTTYIAPHATYVAAGAAQGIVLGNLNGQTCDFSFGSATDLSLETQPLTPGVYCIVGAMSIGTGGITLNGAGTYIFRSTGALNVVGGAVVTLTNGAYAGDIFWTPVATTINTTAIFQGTVIDDAGITSNAGVSWIGRALGYGAGLGAVTTDTTTITVPRPTATTASLENDSATTIKIRINGAGFNTFVGSGTTTANLVDKSRITYDGVNPTVATMVDSTTIDATFLISALATNGTGKSGGALTVDANTIKDVSDIKNIAISIADGSITDNANPIVVITDDQVGTANIAGGDVAFTFTFSETVTGFDVTDVAIVNGVANGVVAGGPAVYTLNVTPTAGFEGNMTVDVAAAAAIDTASNGNTIAVTDTQAVDTLAPTVVSATTSDNNSNGKIDRITVVYSTAVNDPNYDALNVTGYLDLNTGTGSGTTTLIYNITEGVVADTAATPPLVFTAANATDLAVNNLDITGAPANAVDGAKPTVISSIITGPNTVIVVYSEAVTSTLLDYSSENFTPGGPSDMTGISGSGTDTITLTFAVPTVGTGATGTMTIGATVVDVSPATNSLIAVPAQVLTDGQSPNIVITDDEAGTANIAGGDVEYTLTFSEAVTGFAVAEVVVAGGTKALAFASGADGSSVYTLLVTPTPSFEGNMTVDVAAGVAIDAASNGNTIALTDTQAVDMLAPTASISYPVDSTTYNIASPFTAFVINTTGAASCEYDNGAGFTSLTGCLASNIPAPADSPTPQTIQIRTTDAAGNPTTSSLITYTNDVTAPTASISYPVDSTTYNIASPFTAFAIDTTGAATCEYNNGAGYVVFDCDPANIPAPADSPALQTIQIRTTDAAGNITTSSVITYTNDVTAPTTPTIDMVATDDVINAAERTATVTVTGTNESGAAVTLNGNVATADTLTTWSYVLDAATINAFGQGAETLTAVATDANGNPSANGTRAISVDTVVPTTPTIDMVATDDVINAAERTATVTVTGTNESGAAVTLNGNAATADTATTWSYILDAATINAFGQGAETLTAVATDANGNPSANGTRAISVDTVVPTTPTIDMVASDDVINAAERTATVTVTGGNEAGSTVTLNGNATTIDTATTWSYVLDAATINAFGQGAETLTAVATDANGNPSANGTRAISVDTVVPATQNIPVFPSNISRPINSQVTIGSSGDVTNEVWFAPNGTTSFIAGTNKTKAVNGTSTTIFAPSDVGTYYAYVIDAAGNISSQSMAILTATRVSSGGGSPSQSFSGLIDVNNGAAVTSSREVNIYITFGNASQIILSEDINMTGASYQPVASIIPLTLSDGAGLKTVYAYLKNSTGISQIISDTIEYNPTVPIVPPVIEPGLVLNDPAPAAPLPSEIKMGSLVKLADLTTVYFIDNDNRRHTFPNPINFLSWFGDYSQVQIISSDLMAQIPLGSNVTIRPGTYFVKIQTDPKVYAIESYGVLRWIPDEATAIGLFGSNWATRVRDVSDAFFTNYQLGTVLTATSHPEGSLIQYSGDSKVYIIDSGTKRYISSDSFLKNYFQNQFKSVISTSMAYANGLDFPVTPIETLMKLR